MAIFAVAQLAIPVSRLGPPHTPERFAWQMYSNLSAWPDFEVVTPSGTERVNARRFVVEDRAEIDLTFWLPPHLCSLFPDASEVSWDEGEHQCATG